MRLYLKFFQMHMQSQMQYKLSFFLTALGQFFVSFTTLGGVYFMLSRFNSVEGFTLPQVMLCFGVSTMSFSLAEMFGHGFDMFPRMIGNGEFDRALVRPRSAIFQVLVSQMDFTRIGKLLQAIFIFCFCLPRSGVNWSGDKILTLVLMILCGTIVFCCLFLLYAAFSFFTIEGLEFMNIFTYGGNEFGRYPYVIYGETVLKFLTFVIPLALYQYYPLLYLLEIETSKAYMFTPLLSIIFAAPVYAFWRYGLKKYKSTGS